ncbi:MAG: HNH endonuclease [Actinomycetota bacterium]|nr:HNH endonuclease [Actinomycetota bacterium]
MRTYIGVTDSVWAGFLQARPGLEEVNFWRPSADTSFSALQPGEPFLFKTHHPDNSIIGGAFFEGYVPLRVSEAWDFFGPGNGVDSAASLLEAISRYRRTPSRQVDNPTIGCIILSDVHWFGDHSLPAPSSFAKNVVRGKGYGPGEDSVVDQALAQLLATEISATSDETGFTPGLVHGPTRGNPTLFVPRLGQGAFRALVLDAYSSHCAITGHKIRPTLQAAHIRPVADGGQHRVDNGLLLRSDIHTLFDLGYVSVSKEHRLLVSGRLREDFGNGDDLYSLAAAAHPINLPKRRLDQPSGEALEWHNDEVFLG